MYDKLKPCTKKGNFHARALDLEGDGQTLNGTPAFSEVKDNDSAEL
jgi:hypothetical protein